MRCFARIIVWGGISASMVMSVVHAADGKVAFAGELSEVTCQAYVFDNSKGSRTNQQVITGGVYRSQPWRGYLVLPEVRTQDLAVAGTIAKQTPFYIMFNDCSAVDRAISVHFTSISANAAGRLTSTGTAKGVEVVILNENQDVVKVGFPSAEQNRSPTTSKTVNGRTAKIPFYVGYYAAGPVKSGTVSAVLEYTFTYP